MQEVIVKRLEEQWAAWVDDPLMPMGFGSTGEAAVADYERRVKNGERDEPERRGSRRKTCNQ